MISSRKEKGYKMTEAEKEAIVRKNVQEWRKRHKKALDKVEFFRGFNSLAAKLENLKSKKGVRV